MDNKEKLAEVVYQNLIQYLDGINLKYRTEEQENRYKVEFYMAGDDLKMHFFFYVDKKRQLLVVHCPQEFEFEREQLGDAGVAVCAINYRLVNGCFDMDPTDGQILFRAVVPFHESILGDEVFRYLMSISVNTVDEYNDKLFDLRRGKLTLDDFLRELDYDM